MSCRHLSLSFVARVERVKDALVGHHGHRRRRTYSCSGGRAHEELASSPDVRAVCDLSLSVTCSCGDQRVWGAGPGQGPR